MDRLRIDLDYLIDTLVDLVRINSINPSLVHGAPGEAKIAAYIADSLLMLGLEVSNHEPEPGRVSVVGRLRGSGNGPCLMLYAHEDTVGIEGMSDPFAAEIHNGKLFGRGAYDMKGSLAACMAAVKAIVDDGMLLNGDVLFAAVADEENSSIGIINILNRYKVDGAVVTEPTDLDLCLAHKGFSLFEVETVGRAAHGSRYKDGVDANLHMARFLKEIDHYAEELEHQNAHPLVGPPSIHVPLIKGGTQLFMYASRCVSHLERRTIPGETEAQVIGSLQTIIDRLSEENPTFSAALRPYFNRQPFEIEPRANIVRIVSKAITEVLDQEPEFIGQSFWMDAALIADAKIETVAIGPVGSGLHSQEEWVDLKSLEDLANILIITAHHYCVWPDAKTHDRI